VENPNAPGPPSWPAGDPKSPTAMERGEQFGPVPLTTPGKLALWKQFFQTQKAQ